MKSNMAKEYSSGPQTRIHKNEATRATTSTINAKGEGYTSGSGATLSLVQINNLAAIHGNTTTKVSSGTIFLTATAQSRTKKERGEPNSYMAGK